jgi:hypothetical protein
VPFVLARVLLLAAHPAGSVLVEEVTAMAVAWVALGGSQGTVRVVDARTS